ncbi:MULTISPECIES: helix-turn-helix transcriptional regulator [Streptomyces]|uniref:Helix-turn-helix transcriptional regulator n=1 Tax=Streptomyces ureilyticus TaxID=1775131 RepID=A0ABX0E4G8_9ACTN|nr:LuxR C-terminal-related transcriptional regulator [Streptomyces ureilyticus]NGO47780.1 helix-turn-helix transcriptional regulator [Streptomyces ureilyticus]
MIKVGIFEAFPIFAHGLTDILVRAGFTVIGVHTVWEERRTTGADVFLVARETVHNTSPGAFTAEIPPGVPVVLIVPAGDNRTLEEYRRAGAAATIDRSAPASTVVEVVRTVTFDGIAPHSQLADLTEQNVEPGALSPREQQVLARIAVGLTHGQIARALAISPHTVDTYVKRIRSKLDLGNKAELTRAAMLSGLDAGSDVCGQVSGVG